MTIALNEFFKEHSLLFLFSKIILATYIVAFLTSLFYKRKMVSIENDIFKIKKQRESLIKRHSIEHNFELKLLKLDLNENRLHDEYEKFSLIIAQTILTILLFIILVEFGQISSKDIFKEYFLSAISSIIGVAGIAKWLQYPFAVFISFMGKNYSIVFDCLFVFSDIVLMFMLNSLWSYLAFTVIIFIVWILKKHFIDK